MIVELAGLPGAGKSTLARASLAMLRSSGFIPMSEARQFQPLTGLGRVRAAADHRRMLVVGGRALAASSRSWALRWEAMRYLTVSATNHVTAAATGSPVLMEEGPVQRGFMCLVDRRGASADQVVDRYARALPTDSLVVHVVVPVEVAIERLARRPRSLPSRFDGLSTEEIDRVLREGSAVLDRLVESRRAAGAPTPITIDGTSDGAAVEVADLLKARL